MRVRTLEPKAFAARMRRLKGALKAEGLEGGVVVPGPNLRYLTGVNSLLLERPFMLLVPVEGDPQLVAPKLEAGPYLSAPVDLSVHEWTDSEGWEGAIRDAVGEARPKGRWGVEGRVPFLFLHRLKKLASPEFDDAEPIMQGLREVKDEAESRLLRRAGEILSRSFERFPEVLREGVSELEVARRATEIIYENGGTKVDDVLVQSGPRAADPHGLPTSRKMRKGEGVIIDIGSTFEGYYADITRTYCLGRSKELEEVYSHVLAAEESGIEAGVKGAAVGKVDGAARGLLTRAGLGRHFIHRTGHGLGLEVHEAPYIVEGGEEKLRDGMCYTVEPGVYLRGKLGVRIEDDVLMHGGRAVEITSPPKEYGWWE